MATVEKITLNLKDAIYILIIVASVVSGHFTVEAKTTENALKIEQLQKEQAMTRLSNDQVREELSEVKAIVMEIKGYLKKQD